MKYNLNKRLICGIVTIFTLVTIFWSCGFEWGWWTGNVDHIVYESSSAKAGEYANFELNFRVETNESHNDKLVIAVQVPKSWNPREEGNIEMTYQIINRGDEPQPMQIIPIGTSPFKTPGLTWEQMLLNKFGDNDPNVLDDMQWVAFVSEATINQNNVKWDYKAQIKIKTGPNNLRAKIGFCLYSENDGGGDIWSNDNATWLLYAVDWGDCFEVYDGEGAIMDFCELHFNQQTPGLSTQNDIVTLRYNGDIAENDLMEEAEKSNAEIYLHATATTSDGRIIEISEKSEKTRMMKESLWSLTYSKTFWPESFFNLSAGETLIKIEYYFTNNDGTIYISQYDDDYKDEPEENPQWTQKPLEPFVFELG